MLDYIKTITRGDNFTKIISLFYNSLKNNLYPEEIDKKLKELYYEVSIYNRNVFPIKGYDINNPSNVLEIIHALPYRRKIIDIFKTLPSVAKRNLKDDIRQERNWLDLENYYGRLEYFIGYYSLLDNKPPKIKNKIINKIFKSGCSLETCLDFVENKENLLIGTTLTRNNLYKSSENFYNHIDIVLDTKDYSIVRVSDICGIKEIGSDSLWCFTYGRNDYRQWEEYSYNNMVYVIIDWTNSKNPIDFMYLLIEPLINRDGLKPLSLCEDFYPLYNLINENYYCPFSVLSNIFGENYMGIIKKYLTFELQ